MNPTRLLAGPPLGAGPETLADHRRRLGPRPSVGDPSSLIGTLTASGLLGRGGAAFPVGRKWTTVAGRAEGGAVVLVNGAEGEPLSTKDQALMTARPHLVLDGAELAAEAVGADRVIVYVGTAHAAAKASLQRAVAERHGGETVPFELIAAPATYIAGEESAAVHFVNAGDARPTTTPPRPYERGVDGQATLVQNVETLAHVALIARSGDAWYRGVGSGPTKGTAMVTVSGQVAHPGVTEIALGTTIREVAAVAAAGDGIGAILLGGYFGGWIRAHEAWELRLDPVDLRHSGSLFGCGAIHFLPSARCGVRATAQILDLMAGSSAAQCGPCVFGLRAIADATARLATTATARGEDLERILRWSNQLAGRGACRHPDGAAGLLQSALRVFADEFARHERSRTCVEMDHRWRAA